jgi:hypothetical protein
MPAESTPPLGVVSAAATAGAKAVSAGVTVGPLRLAVTLEQKVEGVIDERSLRPLLFHGKDRELLPRSAPSSRPDFMV